MDARWTGEPVAALDPCVARTVQRFLAIVRVTTSCFQVTCLLQMHLSLNDGSSFTPVDVAARRACLRELRLLLRQRAE